MRKCKECGLKIRANGKTEEERMENHQNGLHHKQRVNAKKKETVEKGLSFR